MPLDILFWNSTGLDRAKLTAVLTIAINHNIDLVVLQEVSSTASGLAPPHGYTLAAHDKESVGGTATSKYYAVYYRGVVTSVVSLGLMTIPPAPRRANDEYLTACRRRSFPSKHRTKPPMRMIRTGPFEAPLELLRPVGVEAWSPTVTGTETWPSGIVLSGSLFAQKLYRHGRAPGSTIRVKRGGRWYRTLPC